MRYRILVIASLATALYACSNVDYSQTRSAPRQDSIELDEVQVVLPEGKGKEQVEMSCVPCHSLRYIEMQPEMPRKNWEKIVTKMIQVYGAPVRDSASAAQIADYLYSIKGKKDSTLKRSVEKMPT